MDILMPQLGETVAEGTITLWHKSVGDAVAPGEALFDIETDKTTMEVPSTVAGVLAEIRVSAGATVPVGSVVAVLSGASMREQTAVTQPRSPPPAIARAPARAFDPSNAVRTPERNFGPARGPHGEQVTPLARRLAAQMAVALAHVSGSGPGGRIIGRDLRAAPALAAVSSSAAQIKALFQGVAFTEVPLDGMRRTIARRLTEATQRVPHFDLSVDIEVDALLALRAEMNSESGGAFKLSINDFIIKAVALALQRVPQANAVWGEDCILQFKHSDVAVAVSTAAGLFTPLVRQSELKSLIEISAQMKALIERARSGNLKAADYEGGSFSISNLGMYDVRAFSAIINPPQSAILAVGAAARRPVETAGGALRFASVMSVTLSCDHRVIDGVLGAKLLAACKLLLQSPRLLMG